MLWINLLIAVYFIIFAFMVTTRNYLHAIFFQVIPFSAALFILVDTGLRFGFIIAP
jgi:hypothetical protein